jgi:hypothetical protein
LAGRWIPIQRLISGVVQFGLGALLLIGLILVLPRLLSRLEGGWLEGRHSGSGVSESDAR